MTDIVFDRFASPLSLVREWRELPGGPPLRELVILGYTLDLAFLERVCLAQARQLGARVTVLADSRQSLHEAVDVRLAGRAYQQGFTATSGAFHPKVAVLVGDDRVWAAVGSGNPTMAGWGHNHELWCILRGSRETGPRVQAELGNWLQRLPDAVPMPSWFSDTLRDVGGQMTPAAIDGGHDGVCLLHNLDHPIVEQLDPGDVDELRLAAPFIDPSGNAIAELIRRSSPRRLRIALQPRSSSFAGRALLEATRSVTDIAFTGVDETRAMHGKLIEWTSPDGSTTAVVGSPNLTAAALCGTVGEDHNCELAVRAPVDSSLLPTGTPMSKADVAATTWNRPDIDVRAGASLRLLGCCRSADGLVVEMVSRHAVDVTIETSVDGSPGSWQPKVVMRGETIVPGGVTTISFVAPEVIGGAVRAVATIRGGRVESAPVFVTDTWRCRPRADPSDGPRLPDVGSPENAFDDSDLARRFNRDVLRLLDYSARNRTVAVARSTGPVAEARSAVDRWQQYLDRVGRSLGPTVTALVYPGARATAAVPAESRWVIGDVHDESELAEGETDAILDDEEIFPELTPPPRTEHQKQRSWLRKWVDALRRPRDPAVARPALDLRMLVAALAANRLAAGIWDGSEEWREQLADVVEALVPDPSDIAEEPDQQQGYLESWVAVCLALLLQDASLHGGAEADIVAQRAWRAGHELAAKADPELVASMLTESTKPHARVVTEAGVLAAIELAAQEREDPRATVLAGLAEDGLDVESRDGVWIVRGAFRRPTRPAARVLTELCAPESGIVVATNGTASTIMVRRDGEVLVAETLVRVWQSFRVRPPMTPASLFRDDSRPRAERTRQLRPLPADVVAAGSAAHVDVTALVEEFLPKPRPRGQQWSDDW